MTYAKSLPTDQSVELNKSLALLRKVVLSRAARSKEEDILVSFTVAIFCCLDLTLIQKCNISFGFKYIGGEIMLTKNLD